MRNNQPVTDKEITFSTDEKLISSTDLKGRIKHCNDAFERVSGFTREELIGQPHNIIRHPDMPSEAYEVMWSHLKANQPWMGLVKNRCKNGDYYWVNAYVTPVTDNGTVIGYESVRRVPERSDIERAEKLYGRIKKSGFKPGPAFPPRQTIATAAVVLASLALFASGQPTIAYGLVVGALASLSAWWVLSRRSLMAGLNTLLEKSFKHDLAVKSYTDDARDLGRLKVAIMSEQAHLDTVLTRIQDASIRAEKDASEALSMASEAQAEMRKQQDESDQVAAAMNQMTATINEVSDHVQQTAHKAEEARGLAKEGASVSRKTHQAIEHLKAKVDGISQAVGDLSKQTETIMGAAQIIEQIAEQTNLLALNAAIEAARAGESGRGFAVVADEVRQLAQRTQGSTQEIHSIIAELKNRAKQAITVASEGQKDAEEGLKQVAISSDKLDSIAASVDGIASMSQEMAAAVEEQAQVSEQINQQIVTISNLASSNSDLSTHAAERIGQVHKVAQQLDELVNRFKR
ncbi:methyl-accepting chemotaxis protein [Saccharospirillum impatiens]|uniref:methyl-accepting chemotaxis protein n=1 Tax=Saccharospirillum impatiens TaxID=169438 RepID=UPI000411B871|nr:PAS domain-containing methyl-accepting chemotaxis protein [Saccharospirillum impatiens]